MPAWLVAFSCKGRAVWMAAAFGHPSDPESVTDHALLGTIENAFVKGYGDVRNLRMLVEGTTDDFRDNYVAGYALYVYLDTWHDGSGTRVFQEPLQRFIEPPCSSTKQARKVSRWAQGSSRVWRTRCTTLWDGSCRTTSVVHGW